MSDVQPESTPALPEDVAGCHALIHRLLGELAETRRKLSVYQENERRQLEWRYGKGVTHEQLLNVGRKFSFQITDEQRRAAEAEIAAEEVGRRRRPGGGPGRKKK